MRSSAWAALAVAALLALAQGARAQCVENPDGYDMWEVDGKEELCRTCSKDGKTCDECWTLTGRTDAGGCVHCDVKGKYGWAASKCDGEQPSFALECKGDLEGELKFGLYATAEGVCEQCPLKGCIICEDLTGNCTSCDMQHGLVGGKCTKCKDTENCIACDGDAARCTECYSGFFVDASTDGVCTRCMDNCEQCSNSTSCERCERGFGWDAAAQKCSPCGEGCDSCEVAGQCQSCETGYTTSADGNSCLKCTAEHCTTCKEGEPDVCLICATFDEATDKLLWGADRKAGSPTFGQCIRCQTERCGSCQSDAAKCDSCEDGFLLASALDPSKGDVCQPCSLSNCADCAVDVDTRKEVCSECAPGWEIDYDNGNTCKKAKKA